MHAVLRHCRKETGYRGASDLIRIVQEELSFSTLEGGRSLIWEVERIRVHGSVSPWRIIELAPGRILYRRGECIIFVRNKWNNIRSTQEIEGKCQQRDCPRWQGVTSLVVNKFFIKMTRRKEGMLLLINNNGESLWKRNNKKGWPKRFLEHKVGLSLLPWPYQVTTENHTIRGVGGSGMTTQRRWFYLSHDYTVFISV